MALRLIKLLLFLAVVTGIGILGYAYLGDMSPDAMPQSLSVTLSGADTGFMVADTMFELGATRVFRSGAVGVVAALLLASSALVTPSALAQGVEVETEGRSAAPTGSGSPKPLSAIDWLSNSVVTPTFAPTAGGAPLTSPGIGDPLKTDVAQSAAVADVTVSPLGQPRADAVGLLPSNVTGFQRGLWGASRPDDLARRIRQLPLDLLPAMQSLLNRLLLAELDPPSGAANGDDRLFLARVDRLLGTGSIDQADALLTRAGLTTPASFKRGFDASLLLGEENIPCARLSEAPALSPTFPARIFCLARQGDWDAAVLTLGTGRALGYISEEDDRLLSWFLDPDLFEGEPFLSKPARPTPLTFRLYEAIGQHIATHSLPIAFAQADLRANIGWKARAEAGERLARVGAVSDNQIFGLYTERKPAASGGIWDRMAAVQALDRALRVEDRDTLMVLLPDLWDRLEQAGLEIPFSRIFGPELTRLSLQGEALRLPCAWGFCPKMRKRSHWGGTVFRKTIRAGRYCWRLPGVTPQLLLPLTPGLKRFWKGLPQAKFHCALMRWWSKIVSAKPSCAPLPCSRRAPVAIWMN